MATQTLELTTASGYTGLTMRVRNYDTRAEVDSVAVAAALAGSTYRGVFTDLPAATYWVELEDSDGYVPVGGAIVVGAVTGVYRGTTNAAIKADTETLLSRITTTVASLWANLTAMISGSDASAAFTETALANAPAGGLDATETQAAVAAALTAYDPPTKAELDAAIDSLPTAVEIRVEMDDNSTKLAATSTHDASDIVTAMQVVANDFKADVSGLASQASVDNIDTVVDSILVDTGTTIPNTLSTIASYIDTEVAAIKAKTDNLPADPATETTLAALDNLLDAIKAVTDTLSLSAISTNVRTEMDANSTKLTSILADTNELQVNQSNWETAGITTELAKVPKVGETHRYAQVDVDSENKTADVSISAVP